MGGCTQHGADRGRYGGALERARGSVGRDLARLEARRRFARHVVFAIKETAAAFLPTGARRELELVALMRWQEADLALERRSAHR